MNTFFEHIKTGKRFRTYENAAGEFTLYCIKPNQIYYPRDGWSMEYENIKEGVFKSLDAAKRHVCEKHKPAAEKAAQ